jgi:uncharacterized DUF497 family protein
MEYLGYILDSFGNRTVFEFDTAKSEANLLKHGIDFSSPCDVRGQRRLRSMDAEEFDRRFDNGEDMVDHVDLSTVRRPNAIRRINVDFPTWVIEALDQEAARLGVTRQSIIKVWIGDRLAQNAWARPSAPPTAHG